MGHVGSYCDFSSGKQGLFFQRFQPNRSYQNDVSSRNLGKPTDDSSQDICALSLRLSLLRCYEDDEALSSTRTLKVPSLSYLSDAVLRFLFRAINPSFVWLESFGFWGSPEMKALSFICGGLGKTGASKFGLSITFLQLPRKPLNWKAGDGRDVLSLYALSYSTAGQKFDTTGSTAGKIFAPYTIFKGKAALSVTLVLPTFTKLESGNLVVDRCGSMLLKFLPAIGERKYDSERRHNFCLSATEVGSLISLGADDSCEFFHDPSMLSSNAGQVRKSLSIKPHGNGSGYFVSLTGRSLLGGLGNNLSGLLSSSHETACCTFLSQQQRTFIQMRTVLKVVDNSGAKKVMCIQAVKGKKGARLGDTIVASVKEAYPNGKVKKGKVVHGVVVRAAMQRGRCDGSEVKFDDNAVVLVDKQGQPIGTRVFGPVPHELRKKKHVKILSLAKHIA
ncbi:hypothetical protein FNV43_RR09740 [Rhamnella rubrinervis]|uniref:Ribosomal protein L14 n=2 Tax=Rhamnella rubrinervis TaxID=2594499 RepID=A0A8K0MK25_9ROSA|nr:hypothetical protein FNV43_RR09740 [Rhamnella rubrinervis]